MATELTVLQPGEGETIWQLGNRFTVKAGAGDTQGRFALLEQVCAGAPAPLHVHQKDHEAFYVLTGSIDLYVADHVQRAEAGAFCVVPPGTAHSFTSTSAEPARLLVIVAPAGLESFFREVERQFPEAEGMPPPERVGPALGALAADYGLQITGPPPQ